LFSSSCLKSFPRYRLRAIGLLVFAALCIGSICSAPRALGQNFDGTGLHGSADIGSQGVIAGGDDMAFAQAAFDDSKWMPVDEKKTMRELFPSSIPKVVWQRIHIKVNPAETGLAMEAFGLSQAYEVYVNGQRLIQSGSVNPFVRYTEDARIVAPIPDAQVKTGSLTIAVRARALPRWWTGYGPSFPPDMLSIGYEDALRDRAGMAILRSNAIGWVLECVGITVCLVALALFNAQRQRYEYLWLGLAGLTLLIDLPVNLIEPFRNLPANLTFVSASFDSMGGVFICLMVLSFVGQKIGNWPKLGLAACVTLPIVARWLFENDVVPEIYYEFAQVPYEIVVTVVILIVLMVHWRRGNREAGLLLFPVALWNLSAYLFFALLLLQMIPSLHVFARRQTILFARFAIGGFEVGLGNITTLLFFLTIGVIFLRRSTRMVQQQALREGEFAAAREIQNAILPEQVENIRGFKIESVYQPAQEVGGDFFQVLETREGGLLIVVGDVAGKGLPAAMLVSVLVGAIRTATEFTQSPSALLATFNDRLVGHARGGFSTALVANISIDGQVTIANAGHLPPYLDGRELELDGALPLGILSGVSYETIRFTLSPGQQLTFYSDGVIEARNQTGELFGFDRAKAISTQTAAAIVDAAKHFGQEDDITVVTVERRAANEESILASNSPVLAPA
jgi:hypothetical protein